jgi:hypothetical protein
MCSAAKSGAEQQACGARKCFFGDFPGTPLLGCATAAHPRSSVTGLLAVVLPDWSFDHPTVSSTCNIKQCDENNAGLVWAFTCT